MAPKFLLPLAPPFRVEAGGLFVSPGGGRHPDRIIPTHELIFVRSGVLRIAEEGRDFSIGPNECLLLRPGRRHRGTHDYLPDLSFYWIHFHPLAKRPSGLSIRQQTRPPRPEILADLFRRFLDDQETESLTAEQAGCLVALMLIEAERPSAAELLPDHSLAGRAQRFIATHFQQGIHAGDVAREMRCHPDYLGRVYRKAYGRSLSDAIHRKQIAEARHLLQESSLNLTEIALACGFRESRYFRALFARHQGMSPRSYRKLHARVSINTR